ncbi:CopD family protein [Jannaschia sp. S6380]|uniref:CopD family protein n=1 Tax=Jannaschia sp. S6380 TaxID=2926408 RepID=UPI001FF1F9D2|nr:CopD family protein [Jannaschia sp. S6380]MCK0167647.1 CopD family protein [Jannaschia sp. S6380]
MAPTDSWALAAVVAKAAEYAAVLVAMGGPLFIAVFRSAPGDVLRLARQLTALAALMGLLLLALRFGIRSARISGTGLAGATDQVMLGLVADSPLGPAALWRGAGELLILSILTRGSFGLAAALFGALLVAGSHAVIGHSLGDPRPVLAALLVLHLLAGAFWVAALAPLHRVAEGAGGAALLHRFGVVAGGTVAVLLLAGATFAWLMVGSPGRLFGTVYGWTLIAKVVAVCGLLGLAAGNKLRLVPALAAGDSGAPEKLRRAIRAEGAVVLLILLLTAMLTTITTPPMGT